MVSRFDANDLLSLYGHKNKTNKEREKFFYNRFYLYKDCPLYAFWIFSCNKILKIYCSFKLYWILLFLGSFKLRVGELWTSLSTYKLIKWWKQHAWTNGKQTKQKLLLKANADFLKAKQSAYIKPKNIMIKFQMTFKLSSFKVNFQNIITSGQIC